MIKPGFSIWPPMATCANGRMTGASAVYDNYDYVERINAHALGEEYYGDVDPEMQVDFADRESSEFNQSWRYIPLFRVLDQNDFVRNVFVFLMLFVFMAIICMAALAVNAGPALLMCLVLWLVYRVTLRKVGRMVGV